MTVLIATFNGAERIGAALASVYAQTFRGSAEVIVVDDGSTDGTEAIAREALEAAPWPSVVLRLDQNRGLYGARTAGISRAQGEWIAFLDDDDEWLPEKLNRQIDEARRYPEASLIHGAVIDVFDDGSERLRKLHPRASDFDELLTQDRIATSTVLLRRKTFAEVGGYDRRVRAFNDWDLWTRVAKEHQLRGVEEPLVRAHMRGGSIQRGNPQKFELWRSIAMERRREWLEEKGLTAMAEARHHYAVGRKYHAAGMRTPAVVHAFRSIVRKPSLRAAALLGVIAIGSRAESRVRKWIARPSRWIRR